MELNSIVNKVESFPRERFAIAPPWLQAYQGSSGRALVVQKGNPACLKSDVSFRYWHLLPSELLSPDASRPDLKSQFLPIIKILQNLMRRSIRAHPCR